MAHNLEPMDIDNISEFDNKENSFRYNNVPLSTEKGYEELDVSELNMKLRYSFTPASSPMSKSYTTNCLDNKNQDLDDHNNTVIHETGNFSQSLNSTLPNNDTLVKTPKSLPLQALLSEQFTDGSRNTSVLRSLDRTVMIDNENLVNITLTNDEENISLPSTSPSPLNTPEATTPVKDAPKPDGSPIMRGLKSVLNMFRASQSPIPAEENEILNVSRDIQSPVDPNSLPELAVASTPITVSKKGKEQILKRSSPIKESLVFNDDLEKELRWKEEKTILFSHEKIPIHKLFFQQRPSTSSEGSFDTDPSINVNKTLDNTIIVDKHNGTVEPMDISYNDSVLRDKTVTERQSNILIHPPINEIKEIVLNTTEMDDTVFLDCETTLNETELLSDTIDNIVVDRKENNLDVSIKNNNNTVDLLKQETGFSINANVNLNDTGEVFITKEAVLSLNENKNCHNHETIKDNLLNSSVIADNLALFPDLSIDIASNTCINETVCNKTNDFIENSTQNLTLMTEDVVIPNVVLECQQELDIELNKTVKSDAIHSTKNPNELPILPSDDEFDDAENNSMKENVMDVSTKDTSADSQSTVISKTDGEIIVTFTNSPNNTIAPDHTSSEKVEMVSDVVHDLKKIRDQYIENICRPDDVEITSSEIIHPNLPGTLEKLPDFLENKESPACAETITNMSFDVGVIKDNSAVTNKKTEGNLEIAEAPQLFSSQYVKSVDESSNISPDIISLSTEKLTEVSEKEIEAKNAIDILTILEKQDATEIIVVKSNVTEIISESIDDHPLENIQKVTSLSEFDEPLQVKLENKEHHNMKSKKKQDVQPVSIHAFSTANVPVAILDATTDIAQNINDETNNASKNVTINNDSSLMDLLSKEKMDSCDSKTTNTENISKNPTDIFVPEINEKEIKTKSETLDNSAKIANASQSIDQMESLEELILSENNSPYVSLSAQCDDPSHKLEAKPDDRAECFEEIENPFVTKSNNRMSPPLCSKGYNINFDEIENPFVSKTKIRLSPPTCTILNQTFEPIGENTFLSKSSPLKVLTEKQDFADSFEKTEIDVKSTKELLPNKKEYENCQPIDDVIPLAPLESTSLESVTKDFIYTNTENISHHKLGADANFKISVMKKDLTDAIEVKLQSIECPKEIPEEIASNIVEQVTVDATTTTNACVNKMNDVDEKSVQEIKVSLAKQDTDFKTNITKEVIEVSLKLSTPETDMKNTSSSEQSSYLSAGTSDGESTILKQSYSITDYDEINFNPFATNIKMRQSPLQNLQIEDPFATKNKILRDTAASSVKVDSNLVEDTLNNRDAVKPLENKSFNNDDKLNFEVTANSSINNTTCLDSSKATNETVREVLTEDEETMDGPFINAELESDVDKISDFSSEKVVELNEFMDLPAQENDENFEAGEMFIDADAFEFLMNQNQTGEMTDTGKESLFLKFDPLFAKRVNSDGVVDVLSKLKKRQSTPIKVKPPPLKDLTSLEKSPVAGLSNMENIDKNILEECSEDLNNTVAHKPTMAVPPAVNPVISPRKKTTTPVRSSNRLSMNFTSPAMAVIDRLLSMSGTHSPESRNTTAQVSEDQFEADRALMQLRELLAEKELNVHHLRSETKELRDRLSILESQMTTLEAESEKRLKNINELNEKLTEKNKANKSMSSVVEEYERTIAGLMAGIAEDKRRNAEERTQLINDRDEQTAHLSSMEVAFSDLHSKYEKSKQIILSYKAKEDTYRTSIKEFEENFAKMQNNYELLKQHATAKLNHANTELEKINRSHESEVLKLNAMIKRKDLHISSLEDTLAQKTKANDELTAICDELINKVG